MRSKLFLAILILLACYGRVAHAFDFDGASRCVDNCYMIVDHPILSNDEEDECFDRCGLAIADYQDGEI